MGLIVTVQKPITKILDMLQPFERVLIVGCGECATVCQTGSEVQVNEMAERIGEIMDVVGVAVVENACDERVVNKELRRMMGFRKPKVLLVLACGVGVQTLIEVFHIPCVPALDTRFLGKVERLGRFFERCRACGDCVLYETGGICPITRCAKGLMNGPCGGMADGKCEVGDYVNDCAWVLIYERLREMGWLNRFVELREARDHRLKAGPQEILSMSCNILV